MSRKPGMALALILVTHRTQYLNPDFQPLRSISAVAGMDY